ncbi:hypothetical protein BSN85_24800 [Bradyrhizobium brasilense]|uniref:hypothetical protein n=1 Tax=Bradyrhizobium brasilense TaxID=1419277 RepID=UPI00097AB72D|nr:hypothetical protein [Bradyrhizobium brasilense]OMI05515.1 hypothetical protein BSN85_24800 [Bradyrhizobium brasilense]
MTNDLSKDILNFSRSEEVDRTADYASRGRKHAGLSDDELKSQWVDAYRSLASDFINSEWWQIEGDFHSELLLRGIEAPFDLVKDDMRRLADGLDAAIQSGAGDERAGDEALNRFLAFQAKKSN